MEYVEVIMNVGSSRLHRFVMYVLSLLLALLDVKRNLLLILRRVLIHSVFNRDETISVDGSNS